MCGANFCPYCSRFKAVALSRALALAAPTHLMTLTQVGKDWAEVHTLMTRFRRELTRAGWRMSYAYVVEPHRSGGLHVHALVHGEVPDVPAVSELAQQVGMGWRVDLREWDGSDGLYLVKMAMAPETLTQFLVLNGQRLIHATRDYWRTPEGHALAGMDAAIVEARRRNLRDRAGKTSPKTVRGI
jgi:hypothetical protein